MSTATIALGFGHRPLDQSQNTLLDVHLHLDHPATPISLGERWGTQSIGAGFTLQQATEHRHKEHLRVCGCDWLGRLALEERMSGKVYSPEEILQRKPDYVAAPPPKPVTPAPPEEPVLSKIRQAIATRDFEKIEGLRDVLTPKLVHEVADDWRSDLPWEVKDAYAALLLDQMDDCVRPIFQDALQSPCVESRAYAVCVLTKDFNCFDAMMIHGSLDATKVNAAVTALSSPKA